MAAVTNQITLFASIPISISRHEIINTTGKILNAASTGNIVVSLIP